MIPGSAVLSCSEFIREAIAWSDSALGNSVDTIILESIEHADSVPVNGGAVVFEVIFDCDLQPVSPAGFDSGSRILVVKDFAAIWSVHAITIDVFVSHVEMVLSIQCQPELRIL